MTLNSFATASDSGSMATNSAATVVNADRPV